MTTGSNLSTPSALELEAADQAVAPKASPAARRVYAAPRLRHLGSVRELTLGGSMGFTDGMSGLQAM